MSCRRCRTSFSTWTPAATTCLIKPKRSRRSSRTESNPVSPPHRHGNPPTGLADPQLALVTCRSWELKSRFIQATDACAHVRCAGCAATSFLLVRSCPGGSDEHVHRAPPRIAPNPVEPQRFPTLSRRRNTLPREQTRLVPQLEDIEFIPRAGRLADSLVSFAVAQ